MPGTGLTGLAVLAVGLFVVPTDFADEDGRETDDDGFLTVVLGCLSLLLSEGRDTPEGRDDDEGRV